MLLWNYGSVVEQDFRTLFVESSRNASWIGAEPLDLSGKFDNLHEWYYIKFRITGA